MMPMLRSAVKSYEEATAYTDFVRAAACMLAADNLAPAEKKALSFRDGGERVARVLKAAIAGAITSGSGITFFGPELSAFMSALRATGAADAVFAAAMKLPVRPGRIAVFTSITAGAVTEGAAKPIRAMRLTSSDLAMQKAVATIVLSRELIEGLGSEAIRLLGSALRSSVSLATDSGLLTALTASSSIESSGGTSWAAMLDEIEQLLHETDLGNVSKPFLILSQRAAKGLAKAAVENGVDSLGVAGGELMGITVLVTGAQAVGTVTLVDASGLAVADEPIELRVSDQADVQMDTAPSSNSTTPTAASLVSLWETNNRALIAERRFGVAIVRPNSVASLTGVAWGATGDSPTAGF